MICLVCHSSCWVCFSFHPIFWPQHLDLWDEIHPGWARQFCCTTLCNPRYHLCPDWPAFGAGIAKVGADLEPLLDQAKSFCKFAHWSLNKRDIFHQHQTCSAIGRPNSNVTLIRLQDQAWWSGWLTSCRLFDGRWRWGQPSTGLRGRRSGGALFWSWRWGNWSSWISPQHQVFVEEFSMPSIIANILEISSENRTVSIFCQS